MDKKSIGYRLWFWTPLNNCLRENGRVLREELLCTSRLLDIVPLHHCTSGIWETSLGLTSFGHCNGPAGSQASHWLRPSGSLTRGALPPHPQCQDKWFGSGRWENKKPFIVLLGLLWDGRNLVKHWNLGFALVTPLSLVWVAQCGVSYAGTGISFCFPWESCSSASYSTRC